MLRPGGGFKYYVVGNPRYRGNALVLQTPHNTAVPVDRTSASHVDSSARKSAARSRRILYS
jgi:hypothetical protein